MKHSSVSLECVHILRKREQHSLQPVNKESTIIIVSAVTLQPSNNGSSFQFK